MTNSHALHTIGFSLTFLDWTTKDLHQFLQNRFGKSKELEGSMPLLWRCFQFHAYFPFVIDSPHSIDWGGFQRAIAFLAADGEEKLGFDAIGEIIDHRNREFYSLRRMYRSMAGRYKGIFRQSACMDHDFSEWSCEGDLLDILALVQPGHPSIRTVRREEMKEHADRILGPLDGYNYAYIPYNELMNLIKLLLSFRLEKPQRGAPFNTACPRDQVDEGLRDRLAKAIMDQFTAQVSVDVQWSSFERALKNYVVCAHIWTMWKCGLTFISQIYLRKCASFSLVFFPLQLALLKLSRATRIPFSRLLSRNISICSNPLIGRTLER